MDLRHREVSPLIQVRGLHKVFKKEGAEIHALKGIDITVQRGEMVVIVGASGAGKTTLLHILGTLDRPSRGEVLYQGEDVFSRTEESLAEFRNREIGFVFQFHHLLPEFNALENTMMPALIQGMDRKEARERAEEILTEVGLKERIWHKPGELSGGEQQRVAVARALVLRPTILLADEPTGNLDSKTGEKIIQLIFSLNESRGITLVIVTHNEVLARRFPRQIYLADGRVI
ncbi:MAG: lipoprotein-releasing system ATP-binding protein LolD [Deltaproteobacteria bacterium]|nr:MAG: lipoprotein-releasing system ATP-binding protein LolD [Deltaproteobacteria bacterium]